MIGWIRRLFAPSPDHEPEIIDTRMWVPATDQDGIVGWDWVFAVFYKTVGDRGPCRVMYLLRPSAEDRVADVLTLRRGLAEGRLRGSDVPV